jgi:hypothetical protein
LTFDKRVIATTGRQPEYNKAAGAYVDSNWTLIVTAGR